MLMAPLDGDWSKAGEYAYTNVSGLMLLGIFFALHGFDDHRLIRYALQRIRPEIVLPLIALLWVLAMTLSQGSSAKFIYFDF